VISLGNGFNVAEKQERRVISADSRNQEVLVLFLWEITWLRIPWEDLIDG
jgi:hypothetical protein